MSDFSYISGERYDTLTLFNKRVKIFQLSDLMSHIHVRKAPVTAKVSGLNLAVVVKCMIRYVEFTNVCEMFSRLWTANILKFVVGTLSRN